MILIISLNTLENRKVDIIALHHLFFILPNILMIRESNISDVASHFKSKYLD